MFSLHGRTALVPGSRGGIGRAMAVALARAGIIRRAPAAEHSLGDWRAALAVAPGYISTGNTAALRADPVREAEIRSRIPAGRWGRPDDMAGVVVFLASAAADYVNGHVLAVDGG
ncbi:SDR family oxidoreductase [Actinoplanes campanulatus]|nr:SDR family oxidoreductase [Actinoplanes capillaceus]